MSAETRRKIYEAEMKALLDVHYDLVTVPYKGNDRWAGLKGKVLIGHVAAMDYAKRLNGYIRGSSCTI